MAVVRLYFSWMLETHDPDYFILFYILLVKNKYKILIFYSFQLKIEFQIFKIRILRSGLSSPITFQGRKKMFEAKILQGSLLKKIIEAIRELVTDANLDCSDRGIFMQVI